MSCIIFSVFRNATGRTFFRANKRITHAVKAFRGTINHLETGQAQVSPYVRLQSLRPSLGK
ncbi:hypothetical protein [Rhizobium etli]|uniref:hypothetical protein n=1 Tax=Rhizobium etli TaxID=29449 RepID=UPI0012BB5BD0